MNLRSVTKETVVIIGGPQTTEQQIEAGNNLMELLDQVKGAGPTDQQIQAEYNLMDLLDRADQVN